MTTYRFPCRTRAMKVVILVCHLGLILRIEAQLQASCNNHNTYRPPERSDISVTCGTEYMEMKVLICPIFYSLYNESLMALNGEFSKKVCLGTPDWMADPPILKFKVSINENAVDFCNNKAKVTSEVGTGMFSDFSSIQFVNISGVINANDPTLGIITYRQQLYYMFSCVYPMQYLVNNTKLGVSGVSLAVTDNNGSFISTLSMHLYSDTQYSDTLFLPETGLDLKTRIFVEVRATNLTDRFNVLLDRCYATTSPSPTNSSYYDLFVGCTRDGQTKMDDNGVSHNAHFSFEAFRFVEHRNRSVSTFYLHCVTRLCEVSNCRSLADCSSPLRRKRDIETSDVLDIPEATVTSPPIIVSRLTSAVPTQTRESSSPLVGVIVTVAILAILLVSMAALLLVIYFRRRTII